MMHYSIFPNEGGIACKGYNSKNDSPRYIATQGEFEQLVSKLKNNKIKIEMGDTYIRIVNSKLRITVMDYKQTINNPILKNLNTIIQSEIEKGNVTTINTKSAHSRKPNRTRSKQNSGKAVAGIAGALSILMIANMAAQHIDNTLKSTYDQPNSITIESSDIESTNSHITYESPNNSIDVDKQIVEYEYETGNINIKKPILMEPIQADMSDRILIGYIEHEDLSHTKKAQQTKENYYDIFCECAIRYGLDENILLGIATQERGVHATTIDDGGAVGLMQIQYSVWLNQKLDYYEYNPSTGEYEYHTMIVTDENMRDLYSNIHIGARIFQKCLRMSEYNIPVAIQMYNQGYGSITKILNTYATETGKTYDEVLNNPEDLGWLAYTHLKPGDEYYLRNIKKWIEENTFTIINVKNGIPVQYSIKNK